MTDGANIPFLLPGRPRHNLPGLGEVGLHKSLLPPVVNPCTEDFHLSSSLIAIYNQGTQVESLDDNRKKIFEKCSQCLVPLSSYIYKQLVLYCRCSQHLKATKFSL